MLVVIVIVAVLAAALVISLGGSSERRLANESERFRSLLGHACDVAELTGREIGVVVSANGYAFERLDGDAWYRFDRTDALRLREWPDGLHLEFSRDGRPLDLAVPERATPQLVCFSSGELTPFVLTLVLGDSPMRYRIEGMADGSTKLTRVEVAR
jgi:general secretion pathway protein H